MVVNENLQIDYSKYNLKQSKYPIYETQTWWGNTEAIKCVDKKIMFPKTKNKWKWGWGESKLIKIKEVCTA